MATTTIPTANFTPGRCGLGTIQAIVLHEVDVPIEYLDNEAGICPPASQRGHHTSFHYGVSGCIIHQYVADVNTAWSFDPAAPLPTWPVAGGINTGVDPNCYTLNIAVSTGVIGVGGTCVRPDNLYSAETLRCLAQLVCNLAKAYQIPLDVQHIWRHLTELDDMPFTQFFQEVVNCYNAPAPGIPASADAVCDVLSSLPVGVPTATTMVVGADCMVYPYVAGGVGGPVMVTDCTGVVFDVTTVPIATCANLATAVVPWNGTSINPYLAITAGGTLNHSPVFAYNLAGNISVLAPGAPVVYNSTMVVGSDGLLHLLVAPPETPITVVNALHTVTLTASGTDLHTLSADVTISTDPGNVLVATPTGVFVPSVCQQLNALPVATPLLTSTLLINNLGTCSQTSLATAVTTVLSSLPLTDCLGAPINLAVPTQLATCANLANANITFQADIASQVIYNGQTIFIAGQVGIVTDASVPGILGVAFAASELPLEPLATINGIVASTALNPNGALVPVLDLICPMVASAGTLNPALPIIVMQPNCSTAVIPPPPACPAPVNVTQALGYTGGAIQWGSIRQQLDYRYVVGNATLVPAQDGVLSIDASAGPAQVMLVPPGPCDPQDFYINKYDTTANVVTVVGPFVGGAASIVLSVELPMPFGGTNGETAHIMWTGAAWLII